MAVPRNPENFEENSDDEESSMESSVTRATDSQLYVFHSSTSL